MSESLRAAHRFWECSERSLSSPARFFRAGEGRVRVHDGTTRACAKTRTLTLTLSHAEEMRGRGQKSLSHSLGCGHRPRSAQSKACPELCRTEGSEPAERTPTAAW